MSRTRNNELVAKLVKRKFPNNLRWIDQRTDKNFFNNMEKAREYFKGKQKERDLWELDTNVIWPKQERRYKEYLQKKGVKPKFSKQAIA